MKARLNKISNDPRGDGLWICDECNDDIIEEELAKTVDNPDLESQSWLLARTQSLMNHFQPV